MFRFARIIIAEHWAEPVADNAPAALERVRATVVLPIDTQDHGVQIVLNAVQSQGLTEDSQVLLFVRGEAFWQAVSALVGQSGALLAREMFLPMALVPSCMLIEALVQPSAMNVPKLICLIFCSGRGADGKASAFRLSHRTLRAKVNQLIAASGDVALTLRLEYRTPSNGGRGLLCEVPLRVSDFLGRA